MQCSAWVTVSFISTCKMCEQSLQVKRLKVHLPMTHNFSFFFSGSKSICMNEDGGKCRLVKEKKEILYLEYKGICKYIVKL